MSVTGSWISSLEVHWAALPMKHLADSAAQAVLIRGLLICLSCATPLLFVACAGQVGHPLIDAAESGDDARLASMLATGKIPVDHPGPENSTALMVAALAGHRSTVALLLKAGANPNARTTRNSSALEAACVQGNPEIVRLLLDAGADPDVQSDDHGSTPLMLAVVEDRVEIAKMLVHQGGNLELVNHAGQTALNSAAREGRTKILEALIEVGADVNASTPNGFSPLYVAAMNGHSETVRILLDAGADPDVPSKAGLTPLWVAIDGHPEIARLLIDKGADIDAREFEGGNTPLMDSVGRGDLESTKLLLNAGASVDLRNRDDITAMAAAAIRGRADLVTLLIQHGADVNLAVSGGLTPLHFAVGHRQRAPGFEGSTEVAAILIANGANLEAKSLDGETPMQLAEKLGNLEFVELLERNGARR